MRNLSSKRVGLALAVVLISAVPPRLRAQQKPQLELVFADAVPLSENVPQYVLVPPHCDAEGNTYFRFTPVLGGPQMPITKVSSTGQVGTKFSLDAVPNVNFKEGAAIRAFAVDSGGRVHLLLNKDAKAFIVVLSASGEFENTIELIQPNFYPTQLAIFSSGRYLVSGIVRTDTAGPPTGRLFTGVFDGSGNLVNEVVLPPSTPSEEQISIAAGPDGRIIVPGGISYSKIFDAAAVRQAVAGDDDNAYILLRTSPLLVYVVAFDGTPVRALKITAPAAGLIALTPAEVAGQLAVLFAVRLDPNRREKDVTGFVVYDAGTGEERVRYDLSRAPHGYLTCYSPSLVTFSTLTSKGLVLIRAVPR